MKNNIVIQNILRFLLLFFLQTIVLSKVAMGNMLILNILILFVIMLPTNLGRIPLLLLSFAAGLLLDITTNMLGFQSFAFTIVAFARIIFADRILLNNEPVVIARPNIYAVPLQRFSIYVVSLLLLYYLTYIFLEAFTLRNIGTLILSVILNVVITWLLILLYQFLVERKEE